MVGEAKGSETAEGDVVKVNCFERVWPTRCMQNIRSLIVEASPFADFVSDRVSDAATDDDALAYVVEGLLRSEPITAAVDGFSFVHVTEETSTTIKLIGLTYILPRGVLPVEATFSSNNNIIRYEVSLGSNDGTWNALTEAKRWKAVWLYATTGNEPRWKWNGPIKGEFPVRRNSS